MEKKDYYEILGVDKSCDDKTLKSSFRKLAKEYHPDHNAGKPEAEAKFKEISEAYERLKNPESRAAYDRYGHAAFDGGGGRGNHSGGFDGNFSSAFSDIFNDFFGDFSNSTRSRETSNRGSDLRYTLEITLEEAYNGKSDTINVPINTECSGCKGNGGVNGESPIVCPNCQGSGKTRASQGFFMIERSCTSCNGSGQIVVNPCKSCGGQGRVKKPKKLSINIPAGVEDGNRIRLSGQGEAGLRGGRTGDLYIFVSIKPHKLFQRDGSDLYCNVPVSMATAALGGQIDIPTIDGSKLSVSIPEGSQNNKHLRLRGKGMPILRQKNFGDLHLQISVETPVNLNKKQKKLLEEFQNISDEKNNPVSDGFFKKLRDLWH
ncbi:MAG: molecular chaperone DnaJ [Rhodobiaceae bacterium]|nr:molecular chaperone DnaJ [Rhodobiaceae bacterium]RPF97765.1 MAG: molecular chaperone DnaJ [Rhizobiales bacterium TMED227]